MIRDEYKLTFFEHLIKKIFRNFFWKIAFFKIYFFIGFCRFIVYVYMVLGVQLCFRRFPIDDFSGKWWSK